MTDMVDSPTQKQASSSPKDQSSPSKDQSPPSSQKRKGGGFFRRLFWYLILLAILASGAIYGLWQIEMLRPYMLPHLQKVQESTIARIPFVPAEWMPLPVDASDIQAQSDTADNVMVSESEVASSESALEVPIEFSESSPGVAPDETEVPAQSASNADTDLPDSTSGDLSDSFSSLGASTSRASGQDEEKQQLVRLRDSVARLEFLQQETDERIARIAGARDSDLQLNLIDLRLRFSGDPAAAARSLSVLRKAPGVNAVWLNAEIERLQNTPSRAQVVRALQQLLRLADVAAAEPPSGPGAGGIVGSLQKIFRVRRTVHSGTEVREQLRRLELLFLTGQRETYLTVLGEFAARPAFSSDPNVPLHLESLQKFGAPEYALNDWKQ